MSEVKRYKTTRFLRHNGGKYEAGTPIELDDSFAKPLLALGVIVQAPDTEASLLAASEAAKAADEAQEKAEQAANADDSEGLTVPQIKEKLTALNINFDGVTKKADLLALLPKA